MRDKKESSFRHKGKNVAIKSACKFKFRCQFTMGTTIRGIEDRAFGSINSLAQFLMERNSHLYAMANTMGCLFCLDRDTRN
jgi:hypothetical protein